MPPEDIDYGTLFGVEMEGTVPQPEGPAEGETQEVTEQVGVSGPGSAAAETESQEEDPGEEERTGEEAPPPPAPTPAPTAQQREEGLERARAAAKAAIDNAFKNCGLVNPYTQEPITSKEQYDAYRQRYEQDQRAQMLQRSGLTEEEFKRFVENLPEVRQAKEEAQRARQIQKEATLERAKAVAEQQVKEISKLDPSIKTMDDLAKMENYPAFYEKVKGGASLVDAFKLVNFDRLTGQAAAAAGQAARNAAKGKAHLDQTQSRGKGAAPVPAEVREMYRMMNPDATEEEISRHYNRGRK